MPRDSWKVARRHSGDATRTLVCILNMFPLSHRWKSVDNMTDFERRLTQKTERCMTQCEHKRLCGLQATLMGILRQLHQTQNPPPQKKRKKRQKKDKAGSLGTKHAVVPKLIPFAPTVGE